MLFLWLQIKTLLYHGSKDERHVMRQKILKLGYVDQSINLKAYPVVITSYEIIMRDRAALNVHPWKYIIIDEGHRIKNLNCRLIRSVAVFFKASISVSYFNFALYVFDFYLGKIMSVISKRLNTPRTG